MSFENSKGNILWGKKYIYVYMMWCLIKNRGNLTFIISNENMADKRNCKTGSTLAKIILCI